MLISHKRNQQTFAPEVATDRLRAVINKNFTNEDVTATARAAGAAGCQNIKLYFMVGLPGETDEDAAAIGGMVAACRRALRDGLGRWGNLSVSISPFVPQAHTPFQWEPMLPADVLARRLNLAKKGLPRRVRAEGRVGAHVLEACLSRGDRRLGAIIYAAYQNNAAFDAWSDQFDADAWGAAFARAGINMSSYAGRRLDVAAALPWDHIDVGVAKSYLMEEYVRSQRAKTTAPCPRPPCPRCGACAESFTLPADIPPAAPPVRPAVPATAKKRLRFIYAKAGRWRWLSHLELWRLWRAQLARAGLPLARTAGYTPRDRLVLAPALAVGVAGLAERGEVFLYEEITGEEFCERVNAAGPFAVAAAEEVPAQAPSLEAVVTAARYQVNLRPAAKAARVSDAAAAAAVGRALAENKWLITTRRGIVDAAAVVRVGM